MLETHTRAAADAYVEGCYVTDGVHLFRLLDDADDDQTMVAVEDCRSLEIVLVHADDLRDRMRPVEQRALTLTPAA
ncbi:MAG TPA: hypothetical protein VFS37_12510 [Conexibacter sp.]|nr:hypothetical protein [Conexibacter sp.]